MRMKLKRLLKDIPLAMVKGSKEIEITGICSNSKLLAPGNLFVAKKGLTNHGSRFILEAVAAGATAVLTDIYDPFLEDVVQIIHPDVSEIEALFASRFYQHSSDALFLVGITGTNGKTTSSCLIKHLLDGLIGPCGLIGTIEWDVGGHLLTPTHTTPDLITNHKLFYEMVSYGCKAAVMEVSSQALDQGRVRGIEYDAAIFTNLTQDHLDYHKTMEKYAEAKSLLFSSLGKKAVKSFGKIAIVNADSPYQHAVSKSCPVPILSYGIDAASDVQASELVLSPKGMQFKVVYKDQSHLFHSHLIGRFNVYNCLAAITLALSRSFTLERIAPLIRSFKRVPGRLERVSNARGISIFVDYAHTDDALKNVIETLREIKKGKIITVFGCGGDRDRGKRPKMADVAERFSDHVVVTTDNPRSEDPDTIIKEILSGMKDPRNAIVEPDRKEAIRLAVKMAEGEDIVLIAGKGHERYQIFAHQTFDFDDCKIAAESP